MCIELRQLRRYKQMRCTMDFEAEGEELCLDCLNDAGPPDTALLEASTVGHEKCLELLLDDGVIDNITAALV